MNVVAWMECSLGHMWPNESELDCPVCGSQGWLHTERVEPSGHQTRTMVIKQVSELEAEIRHLKSVIAAQARHHQVQHGECLGLPDAPAAAV